MNMGSNDFETQYDTCPVTGQSHALMGFANVGYVASGMQRTSGYSCLK